MPIPRIELLSEVVGLDGQHVAVSRDDCPAKRRGWVTLETLLGLLGEDGCFPCFSMHLNSKQGSKPGWPGRSSQP
jgi:hypothetical protein